MKVLSCLWKLFLLAAVLAICACDDGSNSANNHNSNTLIGKVSISGTAQVGNTLTVATTGLGDNETISYQWKRNEAANIGANSSTYTVLAADVGSTITVTVTRIGKKGSVTSSPTAVVTFETQGLAYTLINGNTAYSVSKGAATPDVVIIPAVYNGLPVTEIADSGFTDTNVKRVIIPNGITRIGSYAFFHCGELTSVAVPASVTNIGNFAFSGCSNLAVVFYGGVDDSEWTAITVGSNNTSLIDATRYYYSEAEPDLPMTHWRYVDGVPAIWGITPGLAFTLISNGTAYSVSKGTATAAEVIIPAVYEGKPVTEIAYAGFSNYTNMTSISIPDSVTSISPSAFFGCSGLTSITIPAGVTGIGSNAFSGCSGLTSITIPSSVTSIGEWAFYNCSGLTSITILDGVTSIGSNAFSGCSGLTSITIPSSVTSIGDYAFSYCYGLTSVTILDGVTSIGDYAFYFCTGLTSVTIPSSVTSIGGSAFSFCSGLTSITIPASVTIIGDGAFSYCSGLTRVFYGGANLATWNGITISDYNTYLTNATRYYYSETNPGAGNYWRFVDGVPTIW